MFIELVALETLDLSANRLIKIWPRAFEGLENLRLLGLESNNTLKSIAPEAFAPLKQLELIWISPELREKLPELFEWLPEKVSVTAIKSNVYNLPLPPDCDF